LRARLNFPVKVNASTNIGSIETRLPLTVTGKIEKSVHGTIGKGEAKSDRAFVF